MPSANIPKRRRLTKRITQYNNNYRSAHRKMEYAWTREIEDIAREFSVDLHKGLTKRQARLSLQKHGKNGKDHLPRVSLF